MGNKGKNKLLPAVIALLGVEHAPGSLPTDEQVATEAKKLYEIDLNKVKEIQKNQQQEAIKKEQTSKSLKQNSLYNRKSKDEIKHKNEIIKNNLADADISSKRVVKKIKELNILSNNSKLAAIKRVKKIDTKTKPIKKINKNLNSGIFYTVKEGDSLAKIASLYKIPVSEIISVNNLDKNKHIKIGQVLLIKKIKNSNNTKIVKKKKLNTIKVTATAYTSHPGQTDKTPFLAAWNNKLKPGMKVIAVSRDLIKKYGLTNGVKVKLKGLPGYYVVRDKMNKRFRNKIDIYMGLNKKKALKWGKRQITISWYK
jgi:3D (Asp-Asp-Asp) domain-containing protein